MGRRRRKSWNTLCLVVSSEERPGSATQHTVLCGEKYLTDMRVTSQKADVTCQACKAKLAEQDVKAAPDLSWGSGIIRDPAWLGYTYRSIWPLHYQGNLVGFTAMEAGWGKPWHVFRVEPDGSMGDMIGTKWSGENRYNSRFEALLAVPRLVAEGKLYSEAGAAEAVEKRRVADAAAACFFLRASSAADDRRERHRAALLSIADMDLTEAQQDAICAAYRALFFTAMPSKKRMLT